MSFSSKRQKDGSYKNGDWYVNIFVSHSLTVISSSTIQVITQNNLMKNYKQWVQYKQSSTLSPESWPIHDPIINLPSQCQDIGDQCQCDELRESKDDFGGAQVEHASRNRNGFQNIKNNLHICFRHVLSLVFSSFTSSFLPLYLWS